MKNKPLMPDHDKINRRKLLGKLGLFAGAGLLSNEVLGDSAGLPLKDQPDIKDQNISLKKGFIQMLKSHHELEENLL